MISWNSSRRSLEQSLPEILIPSSRVELAALEELFQPKRYCDSTGSTPSTSGTRALIFVVCARLGSQVPGSGQCGGQGTSSPALPPAPGEPLKHKITNTNVQDYKRTRMGSSLSVRIQDFCHYSFTAKNPREKHKGLQLFFSFTYKKVQNHLGLKAVPPPKKKSSNIFQRFHGVKQIPTTHSPIARLLKTPGTDPVQLLWVDLHICLWFLKGIRMIFAFFSFLKSKE